jgi:hypothetical protein
VTVPGNAVHSDQESIKKAGFVPAFFYFTAMQ